MSVLRTATRRSFQNEKCRFKNGHARIYIGSSKNRIETYNHPNSVIRTVIQSWII
jgi:hypothetical protein